MRFLKHNKAIFHNLWGVYIRVCVCVLQYRKLYKVSSQFIHELCAKSVLGVARAWGIIKTGTQDMLTNNNSLLLSSYYAQIILGMLIHVCLKETWGSRYKKFHFTDHKMGCHSQSLHMLLELGSSRACNRYGMWIVEWIVTLIHSTPRLLPREADWGWQIL